MAQPAKGNSAFADSNDIPILGDQGASVTAAAAATYAAPTQGASAVTDGLDGATFSGTALNTSTVPTVDELEACIGSLGLIVNANRTDMIAANVELDDLADDVALIRTALNDLIDRLEAHGLIADN